MPSTVQDSETKSFLLSLGKLRNESRHLGGREMHKEAEKKYSYPKSFNRNLKINKLKGERQGERHVNVSVDIFITFKNFCLTLFSFVILSFSPPLSFWLPLS